VRGGGFLLNDEMGDFNPQPGITATDGRIGTPANLVAPGKRMLSSMCPTIVAQNGKAVLITGSPGGRTIINTVFCVLINRLEYDLPLRDAVGRPAAASSVATRPRADRTGVDDGSQSPPSIALREMGHIVAEPRRQGDAHSIAVDPMTGLKLGVADRRLGGWAAGAEGQR